MPLGKYYCDYCDKQFQDTPSARKRHLEGSQHHRARALWYDSVHHSTAAVPHSTGVCHRFIRTGFCPYGDGCKYLHPKPPAPPPNQPIIGRDPLTSHAGFMWGNLPPSLRPPPDGGYPHLPFIDWG